MNRGQRVEVLRYVFLAVLFMGMCFGWEGVMVLISAVLVGAGALYPLFYARFARRFRDESAIDKGSFVEEVRSDDWGR